MASSAHKTDEEKTEFFDSPEELDKKVTLLAEQIKKSKHFIAFTGAGISTSCGIPDFRSGVNTVLPTGPGAWERDATGCTKTPEFIRPIESALPSPSHMALVKLEQAGYLKFLISQNVDGLHRKSGFPSKKLAELHGNTNLEYCKNKDCKKQYLRDYDVCTSNEVHDHRTGTLCENCGEILYDSIINFGENLPSKELHEGFENSEKADLCLVLGSSLRVTPAANMPKLTAQKGGKVFIVNLQGTPLDKHAIRINGMIDDVMGRLMEKLGLETQRFTLQRTMKILKGDIDLKADKKKTKPYLYLRGVDETGSPYTLFKKLTIEFLGTKEIFTSKKEPVFIRSEKNELKEGKFKLTTEFWGHYGEPGFNVELDLADFELNKPQFFLMEYDVFDGKWLRFKKVSINE